jgi:hypothetical protein
MIILCGQPRSGTSMMMRMLQFGGVEIEFSKARDNPTEMQKFRNIYGFFEKIDKPTKTKCFKCLHYNLAKNTPEAKIIFIKRDFNQMLKSWDEARPDHHITLATLKTVRNEWEKILKNRETLTLDYDEVQTDPVSTANKLKKFIGEFNAKEAVKAVDKSLYKIRN